MTLGQMLTWHRNLCTDCTEYACCSEYFDIIDEFVQPRQLWTGPLAASTTLSIREVIA